MKRLFIILLLTIPTSLFAQSNYHAGYVLKSNGDTLKGYIDSREWEHNPKTIDFKLNKSDKKATKFDPQTVSEFGVTGMDTYISYHGLISMDGTRFPDLPEGPDTSKIQANLFLKRLVKGKYLSLFYYNDDIKTRFLIAESNSAPVELIYHEYYNDVKQVVSPAIYKGQLMLYIDKYQHGNSKLTRLAEQSKYERESLESIVSQVNNEHSDKKKTSGGRTFIGVAINSTKTEVFNAENTGAIQHANSISPKVSFGADVFNNPSVQRVALRAEVSFSYINPQFKYPVTISNTATNELYEFNQYTLAFTPQILFNVYSTDNLKIYLDAGISFNFSAYSNDRLTVQSSDAAVVNAYTVQKPYKLEPYWASFPLQIGVTLNKKIEICLTHTGYGAYTRYNGFYASNQSLNLGVKLLLK